MLVSDGAGLAGLRLYEPPFEALTPQKLYFFNFANTQVYVVHV